MRCYLGDRRSRSSRSDVADGLQDGPLRFRQRLLEVLRRPERCCPIECGCPIIGTRRRPDDLPGDDDAVRVAKTGSARNDDLRYAVDVHDPFDFLAANLEDPPNGAQEVDRGRCHEALRALLLPLHVEDVSRE